MEAAQSAMAAQQGGRQQHQQQPAAARQGGAASRGGKKRGRQCGKAGPAVPEAERLALIKAYREAKRQKLEAAGRGMGTTATPQSLAELVRRDAGKAAFKAQQG